ncbi:hypothetical protein [Cellvibrio sp. QJXJ]|uniref:hypothetical protein n=1 Tax=Cellvibrio sp. QJXJ TaxID=2964606 RepID=UPI0021C4222C|nr:hypothetical protein [Cellvibrio sp. QJXJ]UUA74676.1 hypothetical protein NNX04_09585 [Cellvibrio sp. QJXJ]
MNSVDHSKCKNCQKVQHVSKLKQNPDPDIVGMVCIDEELCKKEQSSQKSAE